MLKFIKKRLSKTLYIQIWEHRLKATDVDSQRCFDEVPLVAFQEKPSGKKTVVAIGNSAQERTGSESRVINPFSHPRSLIADYHAAEKLLMYAYQELHRDSFISSSPIVVIHPMEKVEGGLTSIEVRALREAAMGAGAREVHIYQGPQLLLENVRVGEIPTL